MNIESAESNQQVTANKLIETGENVSTTWKA